MSQNFSIEKAMNAKVGVVGAFLERHFADRVALMLTQQVLHPQLGKAINELPKGQSELLESIRYSILQTGGKRFRPALAMLTAEAMGYSAERVAAYAAAVECVHTYSLVHDDLPAMDDDDYRRGQPTNHKIYGEAQAILAGDALLTEAFFIIASHYKTEPMACLNAIEELSLASGLNGMVGGQAVDIHAQNHDITFEPLQTMHRLKTGALIKAAAVGAAHLCFGTPEQINQVRAYSSALGLAFQVADDILDYDPERPEPGSYTTLLGLEQTKAHLQDLTERCLTAIESWGSKAEALRELARFNQSRMH